MMRVALVVALLLLVPLPVAQAQAPSTPVPLLDDDSDDITFEVAGTPQTAPSGRFAAMDLRSLEVLETKEGFEFTLGVAALDESGDIPGIESATYGVDFVNGKKQYRVAMTRQTFNEAFYRASFQSYDAGNDEYATLMQLPIQADVGDATLKVSVPRNAVTDENGAVPFPDQPFKGFVASSWSADIGFGFRDQDRIQAARASDRMPDDGTGTTELPITFGAVQTGHARLSSLVPFRSSNGEETTFVYEVNATNLGAQEDRFDLTASALPAGWTMRLPSTSIVIPAKSSVVLPIVVSIPFGHNHGTVQTFTITMTSWSDPAAAGRMELGVRYVQPPQPAGHHSTVYLHSSALGGDDSFSSTFCMLRSCNRAYFNTLEKDDLDAGVDVAASQYRFTDFDGASPRLSFIWSIPLSPGLELGLDFDLAREGLASIPFQTVLPVVGGTMEGQLVHLAPPEYSDENFQGQRQTRRERTVVGTLEEMTFEGNANSAFQYDTVVRGTGAGDFVAFELGASLTLEIYLNQTMLSTFSEGVEAQMHPRLLTGGMMALPLSEYHDPVTLAYTSLGGLSIIANNPQQRPVNPGETVVFDFTLLNEAIADETFHLSITGPNVAWATVLGDGHFKLASGEERRLVVAVTAPKDAEDEDKADLVLDIVSTADPNIRGIARLVALVDSTTDYPDEAGMVEGLDEELSAGKKAPGPTVAFLIAALAAAMLVRRRRA